MMIDLHNHTSRCKHAEGTVDEYIEKAIDKEIVVLGFSDHAPMDFDREYRMDFDQMAEYEKEIRDAAEKYADRIDIRLGYEVDWLPGHMDERIFEADVDYLIGSVHFLDGWGFDNPEFIGVFETRDPDKVWREYFDTVEKMAASGYFDIIGHLDLIKIFNYYPQKKIGSYAESTLDAVARSGAAIEINAAGLRKPVKEAYPSLTLLKMAFDRKIPITFGSDAHSPSQIGYKKDEIVQLARAAGYTEALSFKNRKASLHNF